MTKRVFEGLVLDEVFLELSGRLLLRSCWGTKVVLGMQAFNN